MLTISKSERFLNDCKSYILKIEQLTDQTSKERASTLLAQLSQTVKLLDRQHNDYTNPQLKLEDISNAKSVIIKLRKELNSILGISNS
jgi:ABC-type lipoprotein release transport system permease subunit